MNLVRRLCLPEVEKAAVGMRLCTRGARTIGGILYAGSAVSGSALWRKNLQVVTCCDACVKSVCLKKHRYK
jgi:hypothetical protein